MKVRKQTLWRVPAYCLIASWLSFYVTVYLGDAFFMVRTIGEVGLLATNVNIVRYVLFNSALFLIVLLLGGLWAFRSMTRVEIAVSAGIMTVVYLIVLGIQLSLPQFPTSATFIIAIFQTWPGILSHLLALVTGPHVLLAVTCFLAPLLFIPFGRKQVP